MMNFLKQTAGKAKKGFQALNKGMGNFSGIGSYLKQIPAVGKMMQDTRGVWETGKKMFGGDYTSDDLISGAHSANNAYKNYKKGEYRAEF